MPRAALSFPDARPLPTHQPQRRYRILLVIEAAGGGAGRHVLDLAAGLLQQNHHVTVAYSPERAETGFLQGLASLPPDSVHELPMRRAVGWRDVQDMYALRDLVGRLRPFDVLHGHSSKAGALLRLAARGTGIPCVYTPHAFITLDPAIGFLKRIAYARIERALGTLASQIVCVSTTEFAHARSLGIPASRLVVVPNGIAPLPPASRQAARLALGLPPHAMVIGTVGRLTHQKAMERLLKAFAMGPAALPDARLVIGGDGPAAAELRAQAEGLGVADRVLLPGQVDGAQAMAAFDVFALPSRYEAFPYVLLEAAARGLPVVMTDTGGAGEAVRDGYNGFVVPQEDAEAFSARLLELGREPTLRRRLGRQSHALSRRFTAERMVLDTLAVYEAVMPAGPAP